MATDLDCTPPYHETHVQRRPLTTVYSAEPTLEDSPGSSPARKSARGTIWRVVFGAPLVRKRQYDESKMRYRVAQMVHCYSQRSAHLLSLLVFVCVCTLAYFFYAVPAGVAIGIETAPPVHPYSPETMAARDALPYRDLIVVRNLTCAERMPNAVELDFEATLLFPQHNHTKAAQLFVWAASAAFLSDVNTSTSCMCAPYLGVPIRGIVVRMSSLGNWTTIINPVVVDAPSSRQVVVRHSQAANFDVPAAFRPLIGGTSDVLLVRNDSLLVERAAVKTSERLVELRGDAAYCVAECVDYMNNVTIWDRALEQLRRGVKLNAAWASELKQYEC